LTVGLYEPSVSSRPVAAIAPRTISSPAGVSVRSDKAHPSGASTCQITRPSKRMVVPGWGPQTSLQVMDRITSVIGAVVPSVAVGAVSGGSIVGNTLGEDASGVEV